MSRNNKKARLLAKAREITALHAKGEKAPAKTKPLHGKTRAWWQKFPSYSAFIKGGKKPNEG